MEKDNITFFYKHQKKINQLTKFKNSVSGYVQSEIEKVGKILDEGSDLSIPRGTVNKRRLRYFLSPVNTDFMITFVFDGLLTQKKNMFIILEFKGDSLNHKEKFSQIDFTIEEKEILVSSFKENKSKHFAHFSFREYELLEEDILDLSGYIAKKFEEDKFGAVYSKVRAFLRKEKEAKEIA